MKRNRVLLRNCMAVFQLLMPATLVLSGAYATQLTYWNLLQAVFRQASGLELFSLFVVPGITAAAIYVATRKSYGVFILASLWSAAVSVGTWTQNPEVISLWLLLSTTAFNFALATWLMLPGLKPTKRAILAQDQAA